MKPAALVLVVLGLVLLAEVLTAPTAYLLARVVAALNGTPYG